MSMLHQVQFWHWWVLGVVLLTLEALAPGAIFLWLGISAGIVGALLLGGVVMPGETQLVVFAGLSIVTVVGWRLYHGWRPLHTDDPVLNRRGEQYIGRRFTLSDPIANGRGYLRIDDTQWRVEGADLPPGATVRVTAVRGTVLIVEKEAAATADDKPAIDAAAAAKDEG